MTREELSQLRSTRQELEELRALRLEIAEQLGDPGRQVWERAQGEREAERIRLLAEQLDGLSRRIDRRRSCLAEMYRRTLDWIDQVPDSELRRIYTLRYMMGKSWQQVANALGNTRSADAVQIRAKRFLEKN